MILQSLLNDIELKHKDSDGIQKVFLYDLQTGEKAGFEQDSAGWCASIIKVPVLNAVTEKVSSGEIALSDLLTVDHKYKLEPFDPITLLPNGTKIPLFYCLEKMIVNSDNEATNMVINAIGGVEEFNDHMYRMGMSDSMLGHLLCYNVPRFTSEINPDGSNITTPRDMVTSLRHIYDESFSRLDEVARLNSQAIMKLTERFTGKQFLKTESDDGFNRRDSVISKCGFISCPQDGSDSHDIGIVNNRIIYAAMTNKIGQRKRHSENLFDDILEVEDFTFSNYASSLTGDVIDLCRVYSRLR